jgi:NAD(P)-dependent dehydrogenase (short-subunit alcohol dehydrogenase family)
MADKRWAEADIPELTGQTAVVTGASAGLGLQIARVLAQRGAHVVLACRNVGKAKAAADRIGGSTAIIRLDLASLAAVHTAADQIRAAYPRLNLLINNAGVMEVPYERTVDGFELTFATNHLGHFALTGLLLDRLVAAPGSRIVTTSSIAHLEGTIDFGDLQGERDYQPEKAYAQSKLANLLFTFELDRRLRAAGTAAAAVGAHPGVVYTNLFRTRSPWQQAVLRPQLRVLNFWAVQNVRMGALPMLRAATDRSAHGGDYFGPRRYGLLRWFYTGYPARVELSERARNAADQARLWQISEQLTGVTYALS